MKLFWVIILIGILGIIVVIRDNGRHAITPLILPTGPGGSNVIFLNVEDGAWEDPEISRDLYAPKAGGRP